MRLEVQPILDAKVRGLCALPYPGHPRGCPNLGVKEGCPPGAPKFADVFDLAQPFVAVVQSFDLAAHVERMRRIHPTWSKGQLACCLYWQGGVRKLLRVEVTKALGHVGCSGQLVTYCPEGMGVDVTATLAAVGVKLEWPPKHIVRKVALIGWRKT